LAKLTDEEQKILLQKKDDFRRGMIRLFNNTDFDRAITSGTGKKNSISTRMEMVKSLIHEIIYDKENSYQKF
jgi:hypothetical protein